ncbi:MAG: hypothetical protein ACK4HQ_07170, partial [Brevinematales bacterium]
MKRKIAWIIVISMFFLGSGCFLFEEEPIEPDVATIRTNHYTVPSGYNLYVVVHNLNTGKRNVAVWGENLSSFGTTKSVFSTKTFSSSSSYPIMGL